MYLFQNKTPRSTAAHKDFRKHFHELGVVPRPAQNLSGWVEGSTFFTASSAAPASNTRMTVG